MKKKLALFSILSILALLLAVVPASAGAEVTKDVFVTLEDNVFSPQTCSADREMEDIHFTGYYTNKYHFTTDANGKFHYRFHYNCSGINGTGVSSGDPYVITCAFAHEELEASVGETFTLIYSMNILQKGGGDQFKLKGVNHLTVNAIGELEVENHDFRCE